MLIKKKLLKAERHVGTNWMAIYKKNKRLDLILLFSNV